jgi:hypothetical protein
LWGDLEFYPQAMAACQNSAEEYKKCPLDPLVPCSAQPSYTKHTSPLLVIRVHHPAGMAAPCLTCCLLAQEAECDQAVIVQSLLGLGCPHWCTFWPDMLIHTCNFSYSGGRDWGDCGLRLAPATFKTLSRSTSQA